MSLGPGRTLPAAAAKNPNSATLPTKALTGLGPGPPGPGPPAKLAPGGGSMR